MLAFCFVVRSLDRLGDVLINSFISNSSSTTSVIHIQQFELAVHASTDQYIEACSQAYRTYELLLLILVNINRRRASIVP